MAKVEYGAPSHEALLAWTTCFSESEHRPACLVIPGTPQQREAFFTGFLLPKYARFRPGSVEDIIGPQTRVWLEQGLSRNLVSRIASARLPLDCRDMLPRWAPPQAGVWELLWGLIAIEDFVVEEPLRSRIDQDFLLIRDVYRALWEARFLAKENVNLAPAQECVHTLVRWVSSSVLSLEDEARLQAIGVDRRIHPDERYDLLCFLIVLAAQNGLINQYLIAFDGLEEATEDHVSSLREMHRLITTVSEWIDSAPCPIGILIGHSGQPADLHALSALHEGLAEAVTTGLAWTVKK